MLTLTFRACKGQGACESSYRKFAKFKGGVGNWGNRGRRLKCQKRSQIVINASGGDNSQVMLTVAVSILYLAILQMTPRGIYLLSLLVLEESHLSKVEWINWALKRIIMV